MACAVQSYRRHWETGELANDLDEDYFGTLPSTLWPYGDADLDLPALPTEEENIFTTVCGQQQRPGAIVQATGANPPDFKLCGSAGEGWWDDAELAPSVYRALKERERSLARIEYRSPQLLCR